ncbi:hypothetical protein Poli38472_011114 [Pythium oligandrum]|uniref:AB hydrolase-1 domain-containing protein n=1 Tax=Pythium oligandrum TaxID=41045 RepID=A0A8K1CQ02_PYTOL|nr:hypothetical protein Poli38472_011114 [Pythium oligandrum]|eukprot:TMW67494.1 hypothetical protein Poli38472_011114 [Pythium oligandrum]
MLSLPRLLGVSAFVAAALTTTASASSQALRVNGWYPCGYSSEVQFDADTYEEITVFECAELEVPLCYEGICESDDKINFFVKRLEATNPPKDGPRKALILAQGGPGYASPAMESTMQSLIQYLNGTVDFYTFDHRGTGRSEFLMCDAAQALTGGSPNGTTLSLNEISACLKDINFQYDSHAEAFSVASAAHDIESLINTVLPEHEVYFAGYSYGTYLAQRILQLQLPQIAGYVFDGVDVLSSKGDELESSNSNWNEAIKASSRRLLEHCFDDEDCAITFNSRDTVLEEVLDLYDQLDSNISTNACAKLLNQYSQLDPSVALRVWLGGLVADFNSRNQALGMIATVQRCNKDDQLDLESGLHEAFTNMGGYTSYTASSLDVLSDSSEVLYNVVVFSERWAQPAPLKKLRDQFFFDGPFSMDDENLTYQYCMFTGSDEEACKEIKDNLPANTETFHYKRDENVTKPLKLPSHASALIFNGGLDFATPLEFGELLYKKLDGSGQGVMMVNFDYGVHCGGESVAGSWDSPCRDYLTAAFVLHDGGLDKIDTSCMENLPNTTFGLISEDEGSQVYSFDDGSF